MIIKLKTDTQNGWRFYDNARAVSIGFIDYVDVPKPPEEMQDCANDFGFADGEIWHDIKISDKICRTSDAKIAVIAFQSGNLLASGECINLYTNAECYLLNDSGKTIERLA